MDGFREKFKSYFGRPSGRNDEDETGGSHSVVSPVDNAAFPTTPERRRYSTGMADDSNSPSSPTGWSIFSGARTNGNSRPMSVANRPSTSMTANISSPTGLGAGLLEVLREDQHDSLNDRVVVAHEGEAAAQAPRTQEEYRFPSDQPCMIRLIPYNPYFPTIEKQMVDGQTVNVGRFQRQHPPEDPYNEGIYYRSTVISRKHAALMFKDGQFFVKDIKSLGGTFVNSTRLSPAGKESRPFKIYHGDVLQFGVDYRPDSRTGQVRNKDKCCEVLVEFPKLAAKKKKKQPRPPKWDPAKHKYTECCICLSSLYMKQTLFIAPCSHTFHYRCIAPLLRGKGFTCPMCRHDSDLQDSVWSLDEESEDENNAISPLRERDEYRTPDEFSGSEARSPLSPVDESTNGFYAVGSTESESPRRSTYETPPIQPEVLRIDTAIEGIAAQLANQAIHDAQTSSLESSQPLSSYAFTSQNTRANSIIPETSPQPHIENIPEAGSAESSLYNLYVEQERSARSINPPNAQATDQSDPTPKDSTDSVMQ